MNGSDISEITKRPLYNASYTSVEQVAHGWKQSTVWQYSGNGRVDGIPGSVDMNEYPGTMADLANWAKGNLPPVVIHPQPTIPVLPYWVTNFPGTYSRSMPSWSEGSNVKLYYYHNNLDVVLDNNFWCKLTDGSWVARNRVAPRP
jgi:hypothetical protein